MEIPHQARLPPGVAEERDSILATESRTAGNAPGRCGEQSSGSGGGRLRSTLFGALGFALGFVLLSFVDGVAGFAIAGGVGGAFLGLASRDRRAVALLGLAGAAGFAISGALSRELETTMAELSYSVMVSGEGMPGVAGRILVGALAGRFLTPTLRQWREVGVSEPDEQPRSGVWLVLTVVFFVLLAWFVVGMTWCVCAGVLAAIVRAAGIARRVVWDALPGVTTGLVGSCMLRLTLKDEAPDGARLPGAASFAARSAFAFGLGFVLEGFVPRLVGLALAGGLGGATVGALLAGRTEPRVTVLEAVVHPSVGFAVASGVVCVLMRWSSGFLAVPVGIAVGGAFFGAWAGAASGGERAAAVLAFRVAVGLLFTVGLFMAGSALVGYAAARLGAPMKIASPIGGLVMFLAACVFGGFALRKSLADRAPRFAATVGFGSGLAVMFILAGVIGDWAGVIVGAAVAGAIAGASLSWGGERRAVLIDSVNGAVAFCLGYGTMFAVMGQITPPVWFVTGGAVSGLLTGALLGVRRPRNWREAVRLGVVGLTGLGFGSGVGLGLMGRITPAAGRLIAGAAGFLVAGVIAGVVFDRFLDAVRPSGRTCSRCLAPGVALLLVILGVGVPECGGQTHAWVPAIRLGQRGIREVAYSPDGQVLAAACGDGVRLYDGGGLTEIGLLGRYRGPVTCLEFSRDGTRLITGGADGKVRLWDTTTRQQVGVLGEQGDPVSCVAIADRTQRAVSAGSSLSLSLWDTEHMRRQAVLRRPFSDTESVTLWDTVRRRKAVLSARAGFYSAPRNLSAPASGGGERLRISPDGRWVASVVADRMCRSAAVFSPDGKWLAWAQDGSPVCLQGVRRWRHKVLRFEGSEDVMSTKGQKWRHLAFSSDGGWLASAWGEVVHVLDVATGDEAAAFELTGNVRALAFAPNAPRLAAASDSGAIRVWGVLARDEVASFEDAGDVRSLAFSPDGQRLATASEDGGLRLWDLTEQRLLAASEYGAAKGLDNIRCLAFSPDARRLATGDDDAIRIWDIAARREIALLGAGIGRASSVAFSPDGQHIAASFHQRHKRSENKHETEPEVESRKCVCMWETTEENGQVVLEQEISGHAHVVAFSPDGTLLAWGGPDKTAHLWDVARGEELAALKGHKCDVFSLAFSPNGKTLASGSNDKTVCLWDIVSRQPATRLRGHLKRVRCVAFSPDGKWLASGSEDRTVRVWRVAPQCIRPVMRHALVLRGHTGPVISVAFSSDGQWLASSEACGGAHRRHDHPVRLWRAPEKVGLWDLAGRKADGLLRGHTQPVSSVCFSPDGKWLATGSGDGTALLWQRAASERAVSP